ncbi:MAG: phosphotransferase, partial [Paracoccaceae bacterium]
ANPAEPAAVTQFQTMALLHLAATAADLPVPRVVHTLSGATEVGLPNGILRLLTYVEGTPLHSAQPTAAQRRSMARMGASLARALRDFHHPAADHDLLWDIKQAARLRSLMPSIADPALQSLARRCLDTFDADVAPQLQSLRWQVVHNDLNPHNVLVDPTDADRISGVLDFGDMVHTPLICDVAVAASYQIDRDNPLQSLIDFAAAWHSADPLYPAELDQLFDLVATRMVTTIAITSWRASRYPENAPYILRNFPSAKAGLEAFANLPRAAVLHALKATCR